MLPSGVICMQLQPAYGFVHLFANNCPGGYDGGGGVSQGGSCHERDQTPQLGTTVRYVNVALSVS